MAVKTLPWAPGKTSGQTVIHLYVSHASFGESPLLTFWPSAEIEQRCGTHVESETLLPSGCQWSSRLCTWDQLVYQIWRTAIFEWADGCQSLNSFNKVHTVPVITSGQPSCAIVPAGQLEDSREHIPCHGLPILYQSWGSISTREVEGVKKQERPDCGEVDTAEDDFGEMYGAEVRHVCLRMGHSQLRFPDPS